MGSLQALKLPLSYNYKYGNFIIDEYTYDLRLESELSDLQSWYAHTDKVGILPGEESERKTVDNYFSRSDVPRCEQNKEGLPCEVMRHKSGRGKFEISATSVIRGNFIPSGYTHIQNAKRE